MSIVNFLVEAAPFTEARERIVVEVSDEEILDLAKKAAKAGSRSDFSSADIVQVVKDREARPNARVIVKAKGGESVQRRVDQLASAGHFVAARSRGSYRIARKMKGKGLEFRRVDAEVTDIRFNGESVGEIIRTDGEFIHATSRQRSKVYDVNLDTVKVGAPKDYKKIADAKKWVKANIKAIAADMAEDADVDIRDYLAEAKTEKELEAEFTAEVEARMVEYIAKGAKEKAKTTKTGSGRSMSMSSVDGKDVTSFKVDAADGTKIAIIVKGGRTAVGGGSGQAEVWWPGQKRIRMSAKAALAFKDEAQLHDKKELRKLAKDMARKHATRVERIGAAGRQNQAMLAEHDILAGARGAAPVRRRIQMPTQSLTESALTEETAVGHAPYVARDRRERDAALVEERILAEAKL